MDKETAIELERLKAANEAHDIRITALERELEAWHSMVKNATARVIRYLLTLGAAGLMFGLSLPENARKLIVRWLE